MMETTNFPNNNANRNASNSQLKMQQPYKISNLKEYIQTVSLKKNNNNAKSHKQLPKVFYKDIVNTLSLRDSALVKNDLVSTIYSTNLNS